MLKKINSIFVPDLLWVSLRLSVTKCYLLMILNCRTPLFFYPLGETLSWLLIYSQFFMIAVNDFYLLLISHNKSVLCVNINFLCTEHLGLAITYTVGGGGGRNKLLTQKQAMLTEVTPSLLLLLPCRQVLGHNIKKRSPMFHHNSSLAGTLYNVRKRLKINHEVS